MPGPVRRQLEVAINGFDFYGHKERLRDDDRLVRERACHSLTDACNSLRRLEQEARRRLPVPTREAPLPAPEALAAVRDLEDLVRAVGDLEARVRALPYPHTDRVWARLRSEALALDLLLAHDLGLIQAAEGVREAADAGDPAPVRAALEHFERALHDRSLDLDAPAG